MTEVDQTARKAAAQIIEDFSSGHLTNFELERRWPSTKDPGVLAVAYFLWLLYDDFREHRIHQEYLSDLDVRGTLARCAAFLRSNLAYQYPRVWIEGTASVYPKWMSVITLGIGALWNHFARQHNAKVKGEMAEAGDLAVWPFIRREDVPDLRQSVGTGG
jgi:hypothetical protein